MIQHSIRNLLLQRGVFLSKLADHSQVKELLDKLAPHETDKKLVRIGGEGDGGYLIPDDLQGIDYCFSPGVAKLAKFESDLASRGISSFLADYSVERPPVESNMFYFEKRYLGGVNDDVFMTLGAWVGKSLPNYTQDLILQMDIEGSEYDVILETPDSIWKMFRIVVIEFHGLHTMFSQYGIKLIGFCFRKLLALFHIVHIHPNNFLPPLKRNGLAVPGVMEITFLRKDRPRWHEHGTVFPHPLDQPNFAEKPDVILPDCWHR
jgi:hypothetical protein